MVNPIAKWAGNLRWARLLGRRGMRFRALWRRVWRLMGEEGRRMGDGARSPCLAVRWCVQIRVQWPGGPGAAGRLASWHAPGGRARCPAFCDLGCRLTAQVVLYACGTTAAPVEVVARASSRGHG